MYARVYSASCISLISLYPYRIKRGEILTWCERAEGPPLMISEYEPRAFASNARVINLYTSFRTVVDEGTKKSTLTLAQSFSFGLILWAYACSYEGNCMTLDQNPRK